MSIEQILVAVIFAAMFIAITTGKVHRFIPALIGAALTSIVVLLIVDSGTHMFWEMLKLPDFIDPGWW